MPKSNATTSRQSGNEDHLQILEAKHKELVRERDDLFIKVILLESLIVELELPVLIPEQSIQISMDPKWPEWAKLELRAVKEDLERLRQEKLRNQEKAETVRERLSSFQAELRGVERQIELLEQRMNDLKVGSSQSDEPQSKMMVITRIKDAHLAVPRIIVEDKIPLILPGDMIVEPVYVPEPGKTDALHNGKKSQPAKEKEASASLNRSSKGKAKGRT